MTQKLLQCPTQSDPKWLNSDSPMGSGVTFESIVGHFGVGLPESLLSHFWVFLVCCVVRSTLTSKSSSVKISWYLCTEWGVAKGSSIHGSRSSREIKLQNASCHMGGCEVTGRLNCFFLRENEWSRSDSVTNLGESKGCPIKGCLNWTKISKVGIPKAGIPMVGIPQTRIPKTGIPKVGKTHTGTLPKTEMPKSGIPRTRIPKAGILKLGIPKTGRFTAPSYFRHPFGSLWKSASQSSMELYDPWVSGPSVFPVWILRAIWWEFANLFTATGGALNPYILNQNISKWHFSSHGAV